MASELGVSCVSSMRPSPSVSRQYGPLIPANPSALLIPTLIVETCFSSPLVSLTFCWGPLTNAAEAESWMTPATLISA